MSTETAGVGVLKVRAPSSRFDIQIERDLIEEVARLAGSLLLEYQGALRKLRDIEHADGRWEDLARTSMQLIDVETGDEQVASIDRKSVV